MFLVVTYDIHDDRRRARVLKTLKSAGFPVQYSVVECDLTQEQTLLLQDRLAGIINRSQDQIRFYFLCESCQRRIETVGRADLPPGLIL